MYLYCSATAMTSQQAAEMDGGVATVCEILTVHDVPLPAVIVVPDVMPNALRTIPIAMVPE
jgi:hypothetical protein